MLNDCTPIEIGISIRYFGGDANDFRREIFQVSNTIFLYDLTPIPAVYCYLVSCAGKRGTCWPAMRTIAACCGCSKNAARDAIAALHRRGFIRKVETYRDERTNRSRQTNNTYHILDLPAYHSPPLQAMYREAPSYGGEIDKEYENK